MNSFNIIANHCVNIHWRGEIQWFKELPRAPGGLYRRTTSRWWSHVQQKLIYCHQYWCFIFLFSLLRQRTFRSCKFIIDAFTNALWFVSLTQNVHIKSILVWICNIFNTYYINIKSRVQYIVCLTIHISHGAMICVGTYSVRVRGRTSTV